MAGAIFAPKIPGDSWAQVLPVSLAIDILSCLFLQGGARYFAYIMNCVVLSGTSMADVYFHTK
jgi:hypothetical protein